LFYSIFILLSEKTTMALNFGRNFTRLGVVHFQVSGSFFDFLPVNLLLIRSHQAEIIIVKRHIQGRNNVRVKGESYSYLCGIKRKDNCSYSVCRHHLQDLTHFLRDCPASGPLRSAIFDTTSFIFDFWSKL